MIAGLGIDLIEVERIANKIKRNNGFRDLVFSQSEISYCERQARPHESYAARFAAKEAFFKALGTGWLSGTAFNEVEIIHDQDGKPKVNFLGETAQLMQTIGITNVMVSLTHVKEMAAATVIIEK
ncbi:holo-ACP synthase [Mucilaginibacter koreensis]